LYASQHDHGSVLNTSPHGLILLGERHIYWSESLAIVSFIHPFISLPLIYLSHSAH